MLRWGNEKQGHNRSLDYIVNGQLLKQRARNDCVYAPVIQELQFWLRRFVDKFDLKIGESAIRFLKLRAACGQRFQERGPK